MNKFTLIVLLKNDKLLTSTMEGWQTISSATNPCESQYCVTWDAILKPTNSVKQFSEVQKSNIKLE